MLSCATSGPPAQSDAICREGFEAGRAVAGETAGGRSLPESVWLLHKVPHGHPSAVWPRASSSPASVSPSAEGTMTAGSWAPRPRGPLLRTATEGLSSLLRAESGLLPTRKEIRFLVASSGRSGVDVPEKTQCASLYFLIHFIWIVSSNTTSWVSYQRVENMNKEWRLPGRAS